MIRSSWVLAIVMSAVLLSGGLAANGQSVSANGTWSIDAYSSRAVSLGLRTVLSGQEASWSEDERWSAFPDLSVSKLASSMGRIQFAVVRDAGTLRCEGELAGGRASGTFSYQGNQRFLEELARRGIAAPSPSDQFQLTMSDVSLEFIDGLRHLDFVAPSSGTLLRLARHGITIRFVQALGAMGYRLSTDELIRLVEHGVTVGFVRSLQAGGGHPTVDELIRLRERGAS